MQITLKSQVENLSTENDINAYRSLGFSVENNGFFKNGVREIVIDTDLEGQYQGMNRLALLRYIREKTYKPIITMGNFWEIQNLPR